MALKRLLAAGVVAGSMAAGAVAGALVFAPGLGAAQESPAPSTEPSTSTEEEEHRGICGKGELLDAAAAAIGIEESELVAALQDGQTIAEVAEANGVSVDTVVDALVAEASSAIDAAVEEGRLTQEEADEKKAELEERMTALVNGELRFGRRHFGPWRGFRMAPPEEDTSEA